MYYYIILYSVMYIPKLKNKFEFELEGTVGRKV